MAQHSTHKIQYIIELSKSDPERCFVKFWPRKLYTLIYAPFLQKLFNYNKNYLLSLLYQIFLSYKGLNLQKVNKKAIKMGVGGSHTFQTTEWKREFTQKSMMNNGYSVC